MTFICSILYVYSDGPGTRNPGFGSAVEKWALKASNQVKQGFSALHFEKASNMANIWQKMETNLVQP